MGSDQLKDRLLDALEGNLGDTERQRFQEALANDPEEKRRYEELSHIVDLMRDAPTLEAPDDFTASVMARVRDTRQPWLRRAWYALTRPRPVRVNLLGAFSGAVVLALLVAALVSTFTRLETQGIKTASKSGKEYVIQFVYHDPRAKQVFVSGSFNNWQKQELPMTDVTGSGVWARVVHLKPGVHEYMFFVDGQWVSDQAAPFHKDDGFGNKNAILNLGPDSDVEI